MEYMKVIKYLTIVSAVAVLMVSCSKPNGPVTPVGPEPPVPPQPEVMPVPPEEVVENNLFAVDFFTSLSDEKYFDKRDPSVIISYIKGLSGRKPLVYMIDRSDFEVGKANPLLPLARELEYTSYFAQNINSGSYIQGTGMLTFYPVKKYDGVCAGNNLFMSGCLVNAPLNQSTPVYVYTSRILSADGFSKIFGLRKERLFKEGVVIGTVLNSEKEEFKTFIEGAGPLRLSFAGSDSSGYDLFVIVPGSFVCRKIESGQKVNHPYYRVTIEKLQ